MQVVRNSKGGWEYTTVPDSFSEHADYLKEALTNVALFTVLDLRATLFSRARIEVQDLKGKPIENDPFLDRMAEPNYSQSQQGFLYQHEFFKGTGNNITRVISTRPYDITKVHSLENLVPSEVDYANVNKTNKFIFAQSDIEEARKSKIRYSIGGSQIEIPVEELIFFYDISNGLTKESRYKSQSRIDALIPALANVAEAQKSKNINLKMSSKHIVSSGLTSGEGMRDGLQAGEKHEIEHNLFRKNIMASESNLNVSSLANDFRKLLFDDGTAADLLKIAGAYGISKDVLNWYMSGASTYENKNTALVDFIQNTIQAEGDDFANSMETYFGYRKQGKQIKLTYDHLPVMQIIREKETDAIKNRVEIAKGLIDLGMSPEKAMEAMKLNTLGNES